MMARASANKTFFEVMSRRHRKIEGALATWPATWVAANWSSPQMPVEKWRSAIMASTVETCTLLENAIEFLPAWGFIKWFLPDNFSKAWPRLREFCPRRLFGQRGRFDFYWSLLVTGNGRTPPLQAWFQLTETEQDFLRNILKAEARTLKESVALARDIEAEASLEKLIRLGFLFTDKGRVWRNDAYRETQALRPPRTKTFLVNGKRKEFHAPARW